VIVNLYLVYGLWETNSNIKQDTHWSYNICVKMTKEQDIELCAGTIFKHSI